MYLRSPNLRLAGRTKVPVPQISFVFFLSSFLSLDSGSNSLLFASSILLVVLLSFFFGVPPLRAGPLLSVPVFGIGSQAQFKFKQLGKKHYWLTFF